MSLILKYFEIQEEYTRKYGTRAVVLMEQGEFYDAYEYDPNNCAEEKYKVSKHFPDKVYDERVGHAVSVSDILGIELTSPNSSRPYSIDNPNMAGFQVGSFQKHQKRLVNHDYIVVRVDQVPNGEYDPSDTSVFQVKSGERRRVVEIVTPATELDAPPPLVGTNNIVSVYIEYQAGDRSFENFTLTCGVSVIDVTTGKCKISQIHTKRDDNVSAIQDIHRFILSQQPREVIINIHDLPDEYSGDMNKQGTYAKFLRSRLELDRYPNVIIRYNEVDPEYLKAAYQKQFFQRVFFSDNQPIFDRKMASSTANGVLNHLNQPLTDSLRNDMSMAGSGGRVISSGSGLTLRLSNLSIQDNDTSVPSNSTTAVPSVKSAMVYDDIFDRLGLVRRDYGRISFILLLQYCVDGHDDRIVRRIQLPDANWLDESRHLVLTYNALKQLNIAPEKASTFRRKEHIDSLFEVVNFTSTRLGYRYLQERLFNPLTSHDKLNECYDMISELIKLPAQNTEISGANSLLTQVETLLRGLPDLERYQRKLRLYDIKPNELAILYRGYLKVAEMYGVIYYSGGQALSKLRFPPEVAESFNQFFTHFQQTFDINKLECCKVAEIESKVRVLDFADNPLQPNCRPDLDHVQSQLIIYENQLKAICDHLNTFLVGGRTKKLTYRHESKNKRKKSEVSSTSIIGTNAQVKRIMDAKSQININLCGDIQTIVVPGGKMIFSNVIQQLCTNIEELKTQLRQQLYTYYRDFLKNLTEKFTFYSPLVNFVSMLDFVKSSAKAAIKYRYTRPEIVDSDASFLELTDFRHPTVERIIDGEYVVNDISLGGNHAASYGVLMYGANSTGKSTLAKALGNIIVMAQSGMYVPGGLRFSPYRQIITRLSGNDDIIKGDSSFMVEMKELRIILRNADKNSLVLGDELCRGTETLSGTGLTIAALEDLVNKQATFIFSTHMHHLVRTKYLENLGDSLAIRHLDIKYDPQLKMIVINRKIQDGPGSTTYGIEVARSLGLDNKFIDRATQIRKDVSRNGDILSTQRCRYNSEVYKGPCLLCGSVDQLEVHHIMPQKDADSDGMIGHMHKNVKRNLVSTLCRKCHQQVTHNKLVLQTQDVPGGWTLVARPNS